MATASELQHMQEHIRDSRIPGIIISSVVCGFVTCVCVSLRFLSRSVSRAGVGKDDYCIIMGLILYLAYIILQCISTEYGIGRHIIVVTDPRMLTIILLCEENIYVVGILLIKYSILLLYHRVFPGRNFRNLLIITTLIITAWALAAFFCDVFTCYPIKSQWDTSVKGTCIDYGIVTLGIGIANVIIDCILLALPLPILWKLQMSARRKVLLFFTLGAGSSACIASIVRLTYAKDTRSTYDETWDSVPVGILSGIEMCTAMIACCIATYRPLVERMSYVLPLASKRSSQENSGSSGRQRWGKISVQREIAIELGSSTNSGPFAGLDTEMQSQGNSSNIGVTMVPGEQSAISSQNSYGSPSQSWQAGVTTNGPRPAW